jgi:putative glycosyltransferase
MDISIVTSLYRTGEYVDELHRRLTAEVSRLTPRYEIVFVNDGSPDDSLARALALHRRDPHVKVIDLSRNFGHHKAMMTGLAHSRGRQVFLIDSDLEEPPELLGEFRRRLEATQADVIFGVQAARKGRFFERLSGWAFFALFNLLSDTPLPRNVSTVRLMSRRYVEALLAHRERETIIGGLWVVTGFEQIAVPFQKGSRRATSYSLARKLAQAVDAVAAFSDRPLAFILYLASGILALSGAAGGWLMLRHFVSGEPLLGWPSLIVSVWLLGGLTLFALGILGVYLSKVLLEVKQRPYTIVREVHDRTAELDSQP